MSKEILLKKGDVYIGFGSIDIKAGASQEDVDKEFNEVNRAKRETIERLIGRIEGALQALGCDDDSISSIIEQVNDDIDIVDDYSSTEAYLAKISELLADGWTVEVYG